MAVSITFTAPGVTDVAITAGNVQADKIITNFLKSVSSIMQLQSVDIPADIDLMNTQDKADALMSVLRNHIVAVASEVELSASLNNTRTAYVKTDWSE